MQAGSELSGGLGSRPGPVFDGDTTVKGYALTWFVEIRIFDEKLLWTKPFQSWEILLRSLGLDVENGRRFLGTVTLGWPTSFENMNLAIDVPHTKPHSVVDDFDLGLPVRIGRWDEDEPFDARTCFVKRGKEKLS